MGAKWSILVFVAAALLLCRMPQAEAVWVWSRDTGEFRNIEDLVRESSKEQLEYAEELEKEENFRGAWREYKKLVKHFPDSILAARAQFRSGRCLEKMGNYPKAFETYQVVFDKYPGFAEPESVLERQFAIAEMYYRGKRKGLPFFNVGIFSGKSDAVKYLDQVAKNAPFSKYAEKGKFMAGVVLEDLERYEDDIEEEGAITAYQFVVDRFPDGGFADDAQYRIAMCYYLTAKRARHNKKAFGGAIRNFRKYVRLYPKGEFVEEAEAKIKEMDFKAAKGTFEVGQYYEKRRKTEAALIYYREVIEKYPLSEWAEKAEARIEDISPTEPNEKSTSEGDGS